MTILAKAAWGFWESQWSEATTLGRRGSLNTFCRSKKREFHSRQNTKDLWHALKEG